MAQTIARSALDSRTAPPPLPVRSLGLGGIEMLVRRSNDCGNRNYPLSRPSTFSSIAAVQSVTAAGKICILDIDVQSVKSVRKAGRSVLDPHYLFMSAPSMEVLEARLRGRCVWGVVRRSVAATVVILVRLFDGCVESWVW